ncbi:uncharacterized protein [Clytia hemisphaerica]|uniref:Cnidarian restricted protein n=1 Tax=Clytia hemisphaerica TaxID=252671 RepID=A0A7M5V3Q9_9CNID
MHQFSIFWLTILSIMVKRFESRPTFTFPDIPNLDHKTARGCKYNHQFYRPGGFIKSVYKDDRCLEIRCSPRGKITQRLNRLPERCHEIISSTKPPVTTTTKSLTTTPMTTPHGCYGDDGKFYAPEEKMSEGFDEQTNWCYGSYCNQHGQVIQWDNFNCKTTPPTTEPMTTEPMTTPPQGCYGDDGKIYAPGEKISEDFDGCYGSYCDEHGQVIQWNSFNCKSTSPTTEPTTTTPLTTTTPTTTTPMTTPHGCYGDDGKFYTPGEKMSEGFDGQTNWCYGSYCDQHGQVIKWDNFNCKTTPPTTEPMTTTTPTTTTPMTTPLGCYGDDGKFYAPGEKMNDGFDEQTNWCYGTYCDQHGQIQHWDNFNCKTTPPTTTETMTTPPMTTPRGCLGDDGKFYAPGETMDEGFDEESNWCYGSYCDKIHAEVVEWDNFNCKSTPPTTDPTTIPTSEAAGLFGKEGHGK